MKDMFYNSGLPNGHDGRCGSCPFWTKDYGQTVCRCSETEQEVTSYILNGRINKNCPYVTE